MRAAPPPAARATPRGRRWTKERVVEDADPYGGWETGRVPHNMPRDHPTPGPGRAERGEAGKNRDGGTSRTPSPTSQNVGLPRCTGDAYGRRCALSSIECSARCGARPGAPPLDPARFFVKKRGKKLLGLGLGGL